jgi:hypothetical protein
MSFLKHEEIYHFDEGATPEGRAPTEPASASPAAGHLARKLVRSTIEFQRTARSVLTVCLSPRDNSKAVS